jgi:DNA-binding NtrC family response regulator
MESPAKPSLLIVDDDISFVRAAAELARSIPYDITVAGTVRQAELWLRRESFDLALLDIALPDGSGLDLIQTCRRRGTEVVVVTGNPTVESAVLACRTSLLDYLIKPIEPARYRELLQRTAQRRRLPAPTATGGWHGLVGYSAALNRLITQIQRVGPTDASVLIQGESGVGKELVARAIHAESGRSGPFIALNCAAVAPELLAGELFGQAPGEDGAASHAGYFEQAHGGTLFLDEITELPMELQVNLLRTLESRSVPRGGAHSVPVDARIIAATTYQSGRGLPENRLREDLFYRLGEFPITIAPLRDRPDDITALADLFLARLNERYDTRKSFTGVALEQLRRFSWPGNVRELRNVIGRAYIMAGADVIADPLGQVRVTEPLQETPSTLTVAVGTTFEEVERRMLMKTLEFFGNDKTKAARALGVSVKTIYNHLAKHHNPAETG